MPVPALDEITRAAALLAAGELVAFPTETVYGLGADAANPEAVAKIFAAKGRPSDHPLIVHVPDAGHLDTWARDIPEEARLLAERFWPGPLTLILKRQPFVLDAVTGGQDTVGLRVPAHPLALALLTAFAREGSGGVAAPSANRFGRISPTTADHVRSELGDKLALVLDGGPCGVGIESTILDLSGLPQSLPRLLRPGAISPEAIAEIIGVLPLAPGAAEAPRASGTLAAHYAPSTAMKIVGRERLLEVWNVYRHSGRSCAVLAHSQPPQAGMPQVWRLLPADPTRYAQELYAALRQLDQARVDIILVEEIPATPAWAAVTDRLTRAVCGSGEQDET